MGTVGRHVDGGSLLFQSLRPGLAGGLEFLVPTSVNKEILA